MLFGDLAVLKGWATRDQVDACLRAQQELAREGVYKSIGTILHDQGVLDMTQIQAILQEMSSGAPRAPAPAAGDATPPRGTKGGSSDTLAIPGYHVEAKLGEGAMGVVYKARKLDTQQTAAVKVLAPHLSSNKEYVLRFLREASILTKVDHPNIVRILSMGEVAGAHYFAMTFIDGESLDARLEREGCLELGDAVAIVVQVASALDHLNGLRMVHRDIKPANILLERVTNHAYLTDLGLSKDLDSQGLTKSGMILGSPHYLSPEQALAQDVDIRTDIYSLGVTFYHLLCGETPFGGETTMEVLNAVVDRSFEDIAQACPGLPDGIAHIIRTMMAKNRHQRYKTPGRLLADLRRFIQTGNVESNEGFWSRFWKWFVG